jgi:branched-chain amino acid transport system substrate-binding protein
LRFLKTCNEWAQQWTDETGKWPNLTLGIDSSMLETAINALKRAQSLDKEKIRSALESTDIETLSGPIKYSDEHIAETTIVIAQWDKGTKWPWESTVLANNKFKEISASGEKAIPIPGSK